MNSHNIGSFPYRIIVAGGRNFTNQSIGFHYISDVTQNLLPCDIQIVCGEARGADTIGKLWANSRNISIASFPANWNQFGKAAGFIRNKQMAEYATHVIAFWDGESRGTKSMLDLAKKYNLKTSVHIYSK